MMSVYRICRKFFSPISAMFRTQIPNRFSVCGLRIGDTHTISHTVTTGDMEKFAELCGDDNPIHFQGPKSLVHGALLNSLVSGIIGTKLPGPGTVVIDQKLRFPNPCFVNEELKITVNVTSVRKIVAVNFTVSVFKEQKTVMEGEARLIVPTES